MAKKPKHVNHETFIDEDGFAGVIQDKYDTAVDSAKTAAKDAAWEASSKGMGQGAIAAAGLVLLYSVLSAIGADESVTTGLQQGLQAFFSPMGLTTLAIGATIGSVADVNARHNALEENVTAISNQVNKLQQRTHEVEKQHELCTNFAEREEQRRAESPTQGRYA